LWTFFTTKMWSGGKTKTVQDADDDVVWERTVFVIPSEYAQPRGQTQDEFDRMHHLSAKYFGAEDQPLQYRFKPLSPPEMGVETSVSRPSATSTPLLVLDLVRRPFGPSAKLNVLILSSGLARRPSGRLALSGKLLNHWGSLLPEPYGHRPRLLLLCVFCDFALHLSVQPLKGPWGRCRLSLRLRYSLKTHLRAG
jgi:hypothetical protein